MSIIIAGGGNFGREMSGWMKMLNAPIRGFIDDEVKGVLGTIKDYQPAPNEQLLVCISNPRGREKVVADMIERGATFHNFSMCMVSPNAQRGIGCIFCPQSLISNGAKVGDFVIVNVYSAIGHDVKMGSLCTLSSFVDICGNVTVGSRVFFGSGSRVLPGVTIGDDAVIGAGAIVVNDVAAGATVYAQPARTM